MPNVERGTWNKGAAVAWDRTPPHPTSPQGGGAGLPLPRGKGWGEGGLKRLLLLMLMLLLPACGKSDSPNTNGASSSTSGGGDNTLVVAVLADADRLDPHAVTDAASMRIIEQLHATLLRYGDTYGQFEPDLAESVELSDDQKTYTVTLVEGATFHSGRPVNAAAVKYSIQRIIDKDIRAQHFDSVQSIETPDQRTVVITLDQPLAPFRSYLAHPMNAIVDPRAVEEVGDSLADADFGAGPFSLVDWQRDRHIILKPHADYHVEGLPKVDKLIIRPIADDTARTTALRTGEVHLVHEVAAKDIGKLESAAGVTVQSVPGTFWEYIGLNCRRPPFDDRANRQTVADGVDRQQLNQLVKFGQATPLTAGQLPPNHWAHASFDLDELIGITDPLDQPVDVELIVDSGVSYQSQAAEVIKQQLKPVGFNVTIQGLESAVFFDRLGKGDFQMTVVGWMGFVDPDQWMWNLFHSDGKYNQQGYSNPKVDQLLLDGRRTLDREQRKQTYAEAQKIIAADAPMVFLYINDQTSAWRDNVTGYTVQPTATLLNLRHVSLQP